MSAMYDVRHIRRSDSQTYIKSRGLSAISLVASTILLPRSISDSTGVSSIVHNYCKSNSVTKRIS